jgi:hypothetical protein
MLECWNVDFKRILFIFYSYQADFFNNLIFHFLKTHYSNIPIKSEAT